MKTKLIKLLKEYLILIPPMVINIAIGFAGIAITDTVMVGRLGSKYLAAASLANSLCGIFFIFAIGMTVAISPLISAANSKEDIYETTDLLKHGIILNSISSLFLYLLMLILTQFLDNLKQSPEIIDLTKKYMNIVALSIIPVSIKDVLRKYFESIGLAKISMLSSIFTFVANIFLNYILIFGNFGFPELKLVGAALATFGARFIDGIFIFGYYFIYVKRKKLIVGFNKIKFSFEKLKYLLKICFPSGLQLTFEVGFFSVMNVMVGWIGVKYQAAHAIALNISRVCFALPLSVAIASSIIVGKYKGKKDLEMINLAGLLAYLLIVIFFVLIIFILKLNFHELILAYKAEPMVEDILKVILPFFILFLIFDSLNVIGVNILRGMQDTFIPVLLTSFSQWIMGIPLAYLLSFIFNMGIQGIWLSSTIVFFISSVSLFFRFKYKIKQVS